MTHVVRLYEKVGILTVIVSSCTISEEASELTSSISMGYLAFFAPLPESSSSVRFVGRMAGVQTVLESVIGCVLWEVPEGRMSENQCKDETHSSQKRVFLPWPVS